MDTSMAAVIHAAEQYGVTPDGFTRPGEAGRNWQWREDYPTLLEVLEALQPVESAGQAQVGHPSAYWVKHQVENDLDRYVSQGMVTLAWLMLGRPLLQYPDGRSGAFLAISKRDATYRRWVFGHRHQQAGPLE